MRNQSAQALNQACACTSLDDAALGQALDQDFGDPAIRAMIEERCPTLFAAPPVYVSRDNIARMASLIAAVESVVAMPAYRAAVLGEAAAVAQHTPGALGVFFGYDFHVHAHGVGLIEINTNAGGAMLNLALASAQRPGCAEMADMLPSRASVQALQAALVATFHQEWRLAGRSGPLQTIAIVDEAPEQQYLYPEFLLFQQLFERHGMQALVLDPTALRMENGQLMHGDTVIDLVYNRLTDFMLATPAASALRQAYLADSAVITPHPQAYALYADKRNLVLLSDRARLTALGVAPDTIEILLAGIPATRLVHPEDADALWQARRGLFFKPTSGYGGRAAYRGDKLTRRVFEEICQGDYVAQAIVAPGERTIAQPDGRPVLKYDIRNYTYAGQVQLLAARLYQGQTTNFRTSGGGFAPVFCVSESFLSASAPVPPTPQEVL